MCGVIEYEILEERFRRGEGQMHLNNNNNNSKAWDLHLNDVLFARQLKLLYTGEMCLNLSETR